MKKFILFLLLFLAFSCKENPTNSEKSPITFCTKKCLYTNTGNRVYESYGIDFNQFNGTCDSTKYHWGACGNMLKNGASCYLPHKGK